jgi:hypothetical protein
LVSPSDAVNGLALSSTLSADISFSGYLRIVPGSGFGVATLWQIMTGSTRGYRIQLFDDYLSASGTSDEQLKVIAIVGNEADTSSSQGSSEPPPEPDKDTDGDGVMDSADKCPSIAVNGPDDNQDRCTDDHDGDGIFDDTDLCPTVPALGDTDGDGCPNQDLGAVLKADRTAATVGDKISFTASISAGSDPTYRFHFGDGTKTGWQSGPTADHTYSRSGRYLTIVEVRDGFDESRSTSLAVQIAPPVDDQDEDGIPDSQDRDPADEKVNIITSSTVAEARIDTGQSVAFSLSTSGVSSPQYLIDYGDGTAVTDWTSQSSHLHTYSDAGSYRVSIWTRDGVSSHRLAFPVHVFDASTPPTAPPQTVLITGEGILAIIDDGTTAAVRSEHLSDDELGWRTPLNARVAFTQGMASVESRLNRSVTTQIAGDADHDGLKDAGAPDRIPAITDLQPYRLVVLYTGVARVTSLSNTEATILETYLNSGGRVILIGSDATDLLQSSKGRDVLSEQFGIDSVTQRTIGSSIQWNASSDSSLLIDSILASSEIGDLGVADTATKSGALFSIRSEADSELIHEFVRDNFGSRAVQAMQVPSASPEIRAVTVGFDPFLLRNGHQHSEFMMRIVNWVTSSTSGMDSSQTAERLLPGTSGVGEVNWQSEVLDDTNSPWDYFRMRIPAGLDFSLSLATGLGSPSFDIDLYIYKVEAGQLSLYLERTGTASNSFNLRLDETIELVIGIHAKTGGGIYTLSTSASKSTTAERCDQLTTSPPLLTVPGSVSDATDQVVYGYRTRWSGDCYMLQLSADQRIVVDASFRHLGGRSELAILDGSGTVVATSTGPSKNRLGYRAVSSGIHYVRVVGTALDPYTHDGHYSLAVRNVAHVDEGVGTSSDNPFLLGASGMGWSQPYEVTLDDVFKSEVWVSVTGIVDPGLEVRIEGPSGSDVDLYVYHHDISTGVLSNIGTAASFGHEEQVAVEATSNILLKIVAHRGEGTTSIRLTDTDVDSQALAAGQSIQNRVDWNGDPNDVQILPDDLAGRVACIQLSELEGADQIYLTSYSTEGELLDGWYLKEGAHIVATQSSSAHELQLSAPSGVSASYGFGIFPILALGDYSHIFSSTAAMGSSWRGEIRVEDPMSTTCGTSVDLNLIDAPNGFRIDSAGVMRWTPGQTDSGSHRISLSVDNGISAVKNINFMLDVLDSSEIASTLEVEGVYPTTFVPGQPYRGIVISSQTDGTQYYLTSGPDGLVIDSKTGVIDWPLPGEMDEVNLSLMVVDSNGHSSSGLFSLSRVAVNGSAFSCSTPLAAVSPGSRLTLVCTAAPDSLRGVGDAVKAATIIDSTIIEINSDSPAGLLYFIVESEGQQIMLSINVSGAAAGSEAGAGEEKGSADENWIDSSLWTSLLLLGLIGLLGAAYFLLRREKGA